jgi:hypothetical protein
LLLVLAGRLWTVLLRQLQAHKTLNATRAQKLGRTATLLLLGLVRVEQRQAAAVRLTAAGGPAVHGVVELQVSSQLVSVHGCWLSCDCLQEKNIYRILPNCAACRS